MNQTNENQPSESQAVENQPADRPTESVFEDADTGSADNIISYPTEDDSTFLTYLLEQKTPEKKAADIYIDSLYSDVDDLTDVSRSRSTYARKNYITSRYKINRSDDAFMSSYDTGRHTGTMLTSDSSDDDTGIIIDAIKTLEDQVLYLSENQLKLHKQLVSRLDSLSEKISKIEYAVICAEVAVPPAQKKEEVNINAELGRCKEMLSFLCNKHRDWNDGL